MELVSIPTLGPIDGANSVPPSQAPIGVPGADAAEISAFVAALLTQTVVPLADSAEQPQMTLDEISEPLQGENLPLAGQGFAAMIQALPSAGNAAIAQAVPVESALVPTSSTALPTPIGPIGVAAPRPSATTNLSSPGHDANESAGDHEPFNELMPVIRRAKTEVGGGETKLALEAIVAGRAGIEIASATVVSTATDTTSTQTLLRAGDTAHLTGNYVGKAVALPVAQLQVFAERINQQIAVMISHNAQTARLSVNPPELGPIEVRVSVVGDEATVHLVAPSAATREALEQALPRLRTAFTDSGVALGNAGVFTEMPDRRPADSSQSATPENGDEAADPQSAQEAQPLRLIRLGLIDAFV